MKKSLGQGSNMPEAVKLPQGENKDEWIAMNTLEVYNQTSLVFGFVSDFCTHITCPAMTAGSK
jgi:MOB kinase activator 1